MEIVPICCVPYVYTHPCVLRALCVHTSLCAACLMCTHIPVCCVLYVYTHPCVLCALCVHTSLCAVCLMCTHIPVCSTMFLAYYSPLFIFFYPRVYSLPQLMFDTFSYFPQMGIREWCNLRISVYAEIDFFSFPRWQEYHLDMGYWLLSILSRLWIWVSFNFWNFRWFECYSSSFYCESNFVWKLKRIYWSTYKNMFFFLLVLTGMWWIFSICGSNVSSVQKTFCLLLAWLFALLHLFLSLYLKFLLFVHPASCVFPSDS